MIMTSQPDRVLSREEPQDLPETKSLADTGIPLYPPMRMKRAGLLDPTTRSPVFTITREAVHMPSLFSSKPLLTVMRNNTETALGTIRFHHMTTRSIQLNINNRETVLTCSHRLKHWSFESLSLPDYLTKSWFWRRDTSLPRSVILVNSKNSIFARIDGFMLIFEEAGISDETADEFVMTAVALAEHARRRSWNADMNLGQSIGDLVCGCQREDSGRHHSRGNQSRGVQSLDLDVDLLM
jgi:hypothetical protein